MKRIMIIALFTVVLSSCSKEGNTLDEERNTATESTSNTIEIETELGGDRVAVIRHSDDFGLKMYEFNLENSIEQADKIVKAHVTDIQYLLKDEFPRTKLTITIDESLYGELNEGEVVTVHELGGIFSYDEYMDFYDIDPKQSKYQNVDMIKELYYQKELRNIGDEAIVCLREASDGFSEDYDYTMPCSSVSFFQYISNKDLYLLVGTDGKEDKYYTYDDILLKISELKN